MFIDVSPPCFSPPSWKFNGIQWKPPSTISVAICCLREWLQPNQWVTRLTGCRDWFKKDLFLFQGLQMAGWAPGSVLQWCNDSVFCNVLVFCNVSVFCNNVLVFCNAICSVLQWCFNVFGEWITRSFLTNPLIKTFVDALARKCHFLRKSRKGHFLDSSISPTDPLTGVHRC